MADLLVDIQILQFASGHSTEVDAATARRLIASFEADKSEVLAVDREGLILSQYRRKMGAGALGFQFVLRMLKRDRVRQVDRVQIPRGKRVRLQECGFNCGGEDFNYYIRTAAATEDRRLVSEDSDYTTRVCRELKKRLSITVADASAACAWFGEDAAA